MNEFEKRIHNDGYAAIDPDYENVRPEGNAKAVHSLRNGHISFFSAESLLRLLDDHGLNLRSLSPNLHLAYETTLPAWARHLAR